MGLLDSYALRLLILVAAVGFLTWILFFTRLERSSVSFGAVSFSFAQLQRRDPALVAAVDYVQGLEIDPNKNRSVLVTLERQYLQEIAHKSVWQRLDGGLFTLVHRETRQQQLRRLLATLYAKKMGKLTAAENEVQANLQERTRCEDYLLLAEIRSLLTPNDNEGIISLNRQAIARPECNPGTFNYLRAMANIDLRQGHVLFGQKHYEEAIDAYRRVLKVDQRSFAAYNSIGNALASIGRHREALDEFDRAITYAMSDTNATIPVYSKARVLLAIADSPGVNPELRKTSLNDGMLSADLAVKLVERDYADFPLASPQRQFLAERYLLRGILGSILGTPEAARSDFELCQQSTVDPATRSECQQRLAMLPQVRR